VAVYIRIEGSIKDITELVTSGIGIYFTYVIFLQHVGLLCVARAVKKLTAVCWWRSSS